MPAAGPLDGFLSGFFAGLGSSVFGFLERKPNRGDLLGLGPSAGESFRVSLGLSTAAGSGVGLRVN